MTQQFGRVCGATVAVLCARAGLADHGQGLQGVRVSNSIQVRLADGRVLQETQGIVVDSRLVQVPGSAARIALWTLVAEDGTSTHWYSRSADGRSFGEPVPTDYTIRLKAAQFDPLAGEPAPPQGLRGPAQSTLQIVQFVAPPTDESRAALAAAGSTPVAFLVNNAYVVHASARAAAALAARPDVRWVGAYHPAYKLDASLADIPQDQHVAVNLQLATGSQVEREAVREAVEALGGKFQAPSATGPLVRVSISSDRLPELLQRDEVLFADRWVDPDPATTSDMNIVRQISGANFIESTLGYTGQGVRGELLDDNVRDTHVDFQAQPVLFHGARSGFTDHGTGCFGIMFGTGTGNPLARGLLPSGQGIFGDRDMLTDRHAFTMESVDPLGPYRAVFQGNAWGGDWTTTYTTISSEMDRIAFDSDLVITQSMSNNGNQLARPEAWAKNIIACGGVLHNDTLTTADDGWFGNSSIGPAADGRIKPDLTHFADSVLTTWDANDTNYANFLGTSSATMITAGYAGLLMQMWHEQVFTGFGGKADVFASRPKAATARALLIHSAFQYPFASPAADMSRMHQGWGLVDLQNLYNQRTSMYIVNETKALTTGAMVRYRFDVPAGSPPFRATLVFKDPPGNPASSVARINDLSLRITAPDSTVYWGNAGLNSGTDSLPGGSADTINTIENVFLPAAAPGAWNVDVIATEVNQDANPATGGVDAVFALVVSGGTFRPCLADWDSNGAVNPADVALFINDWLSSLTLGNLVGDIDGNGSVTPADVGAFINLWSQAVVNGC